MSNKTSNYEMLIKGLNGKDEVELFKIVNWRIDKILFTTSDKSEMLKALICEFESRDANTAYYAIMSIVYAMICCVYNFIFSISPIPYGINIALLFMVGVILLIIVVIYRHRAERSSRFVLNILRFRYETINNEIVDDKEDTSAEDEDVGQYKQYTVKVRLKN